MKRSVVMAALMAALFTIEVAAKDTLAVLPFTGGTGEEGETIAELFSFSNELNADFSPIPRTGITRAVGDEQKFQTGAGMTDPDTIAAIGKQLGAKYVVAGNIAKLGSQNLLIISILKIDDLRQIAGDLQTYIKIEDIQDKLPDMARNIIAATEIDSARLDKLAVVPVELGGNIDSRVADTLAQILSINLIQSGKYAVYPRTATLEQVQTEYSNQASGMTADDSAVGAGRGENPRFVLSVVARRLGSRNMFNASIINLESGVQIIGRSVNYATLNDGIEVMESLARELTGGASGSPPGAGRRTGGADMDAIRAAAEAAASGSGGLAPSFSTGTAGGGEKAGGDSDGGAEKAGAEKPAAKKPAAKRASGGAVFGYGVLNLAIGLGSFVQGDVGGGFMTLLLYGGAAGLIYWELTLSYDDDLAGIPGAVGLGVAGFAALYGFIRPAVYNKSRALAEFMDGMRLAVVPVERGGAAVRLSYTWKF
ncbi:MAG: penicillin-binding protein activator LpoB [Treponema sp.]|nr:penicillin-binding protein activator LpoB [Treponema sp.]